MELRGKLLTETPNKDYGIGEYGVVLFDFDRGTNSILLDKYMIADPCFDSNSENILFSEYNHNICEYNIKNNSCEILLNTNSYPHNPQYVPTTSYISYVEGGYLKLYDRINEDIITIARINNSFSYSWNPNGTSVIYNKNDNSDKIYKFDLKTNVETYYFQGYRPIYSYDGKYIAYLESKTSQKNLIIKDTKEGKEFDNHYGFKKTYRFIPNSSKIAYLEQTAENPQRLIVWDFEDDSQAILMEYCPYISNEFDWK